MTKKTTAAPTRLHPSAEAYRRWVIDGLKHLNLKHKVLEPVLGSQTTISKVLNGKRPLRLEEVAEISTKVFGPGFPPPNGAGRPTPTVAPPQTGMVGEAAPSDDLPIEAIIAPGSWVRGGVMAASAATARVPVARMGSKFADMHQYACPMLADPSHYIICVPFAGVRASLIAGEKVHVRRTRANGEYEDTVRIVRGGQGGMKLELEGEPTSQPDWSINYPSDRDGETIEIRGLVIGRYIAENV